MELRVGLHGLDLAVRDRGAAVEARVGAVGGVRARVPREAGEHARQALDVDVVVGLDRGAVGGYHAAVRVEPVQADREELHHLARVVLVGNAGAGLLLVAQPREVQAHHRMQRNVLDQLPVVAEGVAGQRVVVGRDAARRVGHRAVVERDHEDLRQREAHALAQLVLAGRGLLPPRLVELVLAGGLAGGHQRGSHRVVGLSVLDLGRRELLVEPGGVADAHQAVDVRLRGAEGGLLKEAGGVGLGWWPIGRRGAGGAGQSRNVARAA